MLKNIRFFVFSLVVIFSVLSCDSNLKWQDSFKNGIFVVLQMDSKGDSKIDEKNLSRMKKIMGYRLKSIGANSNQRIIKADTSNRTILIQLPYAEFNQKAIDFLSIYPFLEFRLVSDDSASLQKALAGNIPEGYEINYASKEPLLINKNILLDGSDLKISDAELDQNGAGTYHVIMEFTDAGKDKLASVTKENMGKRLALLLGGEVIMAPRISESITMGRVMTQGGLSLNEAKTLEIQLNAGTLPSRVRLISPKGRVPRACPWVNEKASI